MGRGREREWERGEKDNGKGERKKVGEKKIMGRVREREWGRKREWAG